MDFDIYKEKMKKKYKEMNKDIPVKIDEPSDQELLKLYFSKMVFAENEIKQERGKR